jgi:hypothetical protein
MLDPCSLDSEMLLRFLSEIILLLDFSTQTRLSKSHFSLSLRIGHRLRELGPSSQLVSMAEELTQTQHPALEAESLILSLYLDPKNLHVPDLEANIIRYRTVGKG